jgi:hypothetical protein
MVNILAYGRVVQKTSAAMITTVNDIFTAAGVRQSTPSSVQIITTNPTFAGIQTLVSQPNGSLLANWNAATASTLPLVYDLYIQPTTAVGLFNSTNKVVSSFKLSEPLFSLANGTLLVGGATYFVGVRARDPLGNQSVSTTSVSAISVGVQPGRALSPSDIGALVSAFWDEQITSHVVAGSFGENLDARVSTRATQSSVNAIPVNPLLVTDGRLNALDVAISTRATQSSVDNINTKIGTPAVTVSADILGIKSDTLIIKAKTNLLSFDVNGWVNAHTKLNDDKGNYNINTTDMANISAGVWDVFRGAHQATGSFGEANLGVIDAQRAANLDNLDVLISTRASQTSVDGIQNNTDFVAVVPAPMLLPALGSGQKDYPIYVRTFDSAGNQTDVDNSKLHIEIRDSSGNVVVSQTNMNNPGLGQYDFVYSVFDTDTERALYVFFDYDKNGLPFNQVRVTEVQEFETKLDVIIDRLTPQRAANLDNLDVPVSTLATQTSVTSLATNLDVPVSSRASAAAVAALPTAALIADAVWDENVNDHATGTTTARTLKDAKIFSMIDL